MKMNNDFNKLVGENIKRERKKRNLTQHFVASEIGICRTSLVGIENGNISASLDTLYKLSNLFNCEINIFLPSTTNVSLREERAQKTQQRYNKEILNRINKLEIKKQYYLSLIKDLAY